MVLEEVMIFTKKQLPLKQLPLPYPLPSPYIYNFANIILFKQIRSILHTHFQNVCLRIVKKLNKPLIFDYSVTNFQPQLIADNEKGNFTVTK